MEAARVEALENEFKLLKAEIKQTLVLLKDHVSKQQGPFQARGKAAAAPAVSGEGSNGAAAPVRTAVVQPDPGPQPGPNVVPMRGGYSAPAAAPDYSQEIAALTASVATLQQQPGRQPPWLAAAPQPAPQPQPGPQRQQQAAAPLAISPFGIVAPEAADGPQAGSGAHAAPSAAPLPAAPPAAAGPPAETGVATLTNLMLWASRAMAQLGPEGPQRLLDLYRLIGPVSPALEEMLHGVYRVVTDYQHGGPGGAEEWAGLLLQLHAIATSR